MHLNTLKLTQNNKPTINKNSYGTVIEHTFWRTARLKQRPQPTCYLARSSFRTGTTKWILRTFMLRFTCFWGINHLLKQLMLLGQISYSCRALGSRMGQAPRASWAFVLTLVLGSLEGAGTGTWGTNEVGGHAMVYWGHSRIYQGMMWYSGAFWGLVALFWELIAQLPRIEHSWQLGTIPKTPFQLGIFSDSTSNNHIPGPVTAC